MSKRNRRSMPEVGAWTIGILLLGLYLGGLSMGEVERRQAVEDFNAAIDSRASDAGHVAPTRTEPVGPANTSWLHAVAAPEQSNWSSARVRAYEQRSKDPAFARELPVALLRIPRVELEVPVYAELNERNLNRGAAWVEGTATPESQGNVGIAAHRDGYFRALREVVVGDTIELALPERQRRYRITRLSIVDPGDVSPLHPTTQPALTLVTCYPFHFVGSAPQRYIVRAEAVP